MTKPLSDLVSKASHGDAVAVEELLGRFRPGLEGYLRKHAILPPARESVSDLAQSVCREVLQRLADGRFAYQGESAFRHWLYEAALLKARDRLAYHRAAKRDPAREAAAASAEELFFRSFSTPGAKAVANEEGALVRAAFQELPDTWREVVILARIEGLSHPEIAERLAISEGHSRVVLSRALARLASLVRARTAPGEKPQESE